MCYYFDSIFNIAFCLLLPVYRVWYGTPTFKMGSYGKWFFHSFQSRFKVQGPRWVLKHIMEYCRTAPVSILHVHFASIHQPCHLSRHTLHHMLISSMSYPAFSLYLVLCQCLLFPFSICFSSAPWVRDPYCADFETVVSFLLLILLSETWNMNSTPFIFHCCSVTDKVCL